MWNKIAVVGVACLAGLGSADMKADLEVIKFFPKTGDGSFTLMYSDFSANLMAGGAHNNVCAWDVCRGNRQGLTFSNGEPLWTAGDGTKIGSFQIMTPVHKVRFSKFCARSFDYDPDDSTWWISRTFGIEDGRIKDNDIGYIQIEGLSDFCAVDEDKFKAGAKVGRTPSPIKARKLLQDDLFDELRRIQANLNSMPQDRVLVELATIKKRASRTAGLTDAIIPTMREIHDSLTNVQRTSGTSASGSTRKGKTSMSVKRKSQRVMAVVFGMVAVLVAVAILMSSKSSPEENKKAQEKKNN